MPSNNREKEPISSRDWLILGAILIAALVLRLVGLDDQLWYDEIQTLDTHLRLPWSRMMEVYSMNHHYLYSFEAKALMYPLGDAPWVLRLPALVFGMASIAALWWLAREIAGITIAHVSAALLAVSFHHIWFSQNARGYTELAFFATIGMGLFLRASLAPTTAGAIVFAIVLALSVFTHLTGGFFFFALGLVWLWLISRRSKVGLVRWGLVAFALGGALTLLVYTPVIRSLHQTVSGVGEDTRQSAVPQYGNPLWTVTEGLRGAFNDVGPLVIVVVAVAVALMALGALRSRRPVPVFGAAILVHIVATLVLLRLIGMRIWPRFFMLDIGFVLLLLVIGVREACALIARRFAPRMDGALFGLAVVAMLAISLALALRNYAAPKQDLLGGIAAADALRRPGERIYAVGYAGDMFIGHYHEPWGQIWTSADYARELAKPGPMTLVIGFPDRSFASIPEIMRDRDGGQIRTAKRLPGTLGDGAIVILQR